MNVEIWTEAAQLLFWEHINRNFFVVQIDKNSLYKLGIDILLYVNLQDNFFVRYFLYLPENPCKVPFKM